MIETKTSKKRKHVAIASENSSKKRTRHVSSVENKVISKRSAAFTNALKVIRTINKKKVTLIENSSEIVVMVFELEISMITKCNMAITEKTTYWWNDSRATIYICNNKDLFKSYEMVANNEYVLMGNNDPTKVQGKRSCRNSVYIRQEINFN